MWKPKPTTHNTPTAYIAFFTQIFAKFAQDNTKIIINDK